MFRVIKCISNILLIMRCTYYCKVFVYIKYLFKLLIYYLFVILYISIKQCPALSSVGLITGFVHYSLDLLDYTHNNNDMNNLKLIVFLYNFILV